MTIRTWTALILVSGLALFALGPLLVKRDSRARFCEAFTKQNGLPGHLQACKALEVLRVCVAHPDGMPLATCVAR